MSCQIVGTHLSSFGLVVLPSPLAECVAGVHVGEEGDEGGLDGVRGGRGGVGAGYVGSEGDGWQFCEGGAEDGHVWMSSVGWDVALWGLGVCWVCATMGDGVGGWRIE
jgi:hypothetical protein